MLEREAELEELELRLSAACRGAGSITVVEAAAGLGKSRLIGAAIASARDRRLIAAVARGSPVEQDVAFAGAGQLLGPTVGGAGRVARAALLGGAAEPAAALLDGRRAARPARGDEEAAVQDALYWVLCGVADRSPVLMAVDDAHWLDAPTLRWLHYLGPRVGELPVAMVVATRPLLEEEQDTPVARLLGDPATIRLRPQPLSRDSVGLLVRGHLDVEDAALVDAIVEVTGGNPFYLAELLGDLRRVHAPPYTPEAVRAAGPRSIALSLRLRGRTSADGLDLARAIAVLGDGARLADACRVAGLDHPRAGAAGDELVRDGVLASLEPISFAHPIVANSVYGAMAPHEQAVAHGTAARVLRDRGVQPEIVAAHLLRTLPAASRWAARALLHAGELALAHGAPQTAVRYLARALDEPPPPELRATTLLQLAEAERLDATVSAGDRFVAAFEATRDPRQRARIAVAAGLPLFQLNRAADALAILEIALGEVSAEDDDLAIEVEAELLALTAYDPVARARHLGRLDRRGRDIQPTTAARRSLLAQLALQQVFLSEDATLAADLALRAEGDGELLRDHGTDRFELTSVAATLIYADRLAEAQRILDAALDHAVSHGARHGFAHVAFLRAMLAYRAGRLLDTEAEAASSLAIAQRSGLPLGAALDASMLALVALERDEPARARAELDAVGLLDGELPPIASYCLVLVPRGRLRIAEGDPVAGIGELEACAGRCRSVGMRMPLFFPWRDPAALAWHRSGDVERARDIAREELDAARAWGTAGLVGEGLRLWANVAEPTDTIDVLREAVAQLERSPARLEHARALVDLGAALRRANHRSDARRPLTDGLDLADRAGASRLSGQALAELHILNARPRRRRVTGVDALTPSERRVAQLAANGRSNVEIAQSLFVTRKTVEKHLGNAYAKLEVTSRAALRQALEA